MKRTIYEIMDLLEQKRENVKRELDKEIKKGQNNAQFYADTINRLSGEYDAYTDVICLIASSHLVDLPNLTEINLIKLTDEQREKINKSLREWNTLSILLELNKISKDN